MSNTPVLTQSHRSDVDRSFIEHHARGAAPSVVWGIFDDARLAHSDVRGTLDDGSTPGPDTAYRIASCTKSFTAAAILALRDDGHLQLDDPVTRFVPAFGDVPLPSVDSPVPTIRMLLTMSAGLPTDDPWADRQESMTAAQFDALLAQGLSFESVPGTRFAYSNLGYALLGRVIEQASGSAYRDFIRQRFLSPLALGATGFDESVPARQGVARGARWLDNAWDYLPFSTPGAFSPIGGLFSTLRDLSTWARWLANAFDASDALPTDDVLSRSSRREMQQVQRFTVGLPSHPGGYGYGLFVQHYPDNETVVSHSGGYPGFSAHMRWSTRTRRGIIAFENATYSRVSVPTTEAFDRVVAGQGVPVGPHGRVAGSLWPATRAAQAAITDLVQDWHPDTVPRLLAENVALDEPLDHRRATLAAAIATIGGLVHDDGSVPADESSVSPAHLIWHLPGAAGRLRIEIQLTPENPPRVQTLKFAPDRAGR